MGMLLYMMELQAKEAAEKTASKPIPKEETKPEVKKVKQEKPKEPKEEKKPNRMEIMRMNVATVREYATSQGIEGANAMSGAELKRILVNKMLEESDAEE